MVALVRVVAGQHEDGVLEPRLAAGLLEETAQSHVGVADALVNLHALLGEAVGVFLRNLVGVVAAGGEDGGHEGLLHLVHLSAVVLQERLVPDGPKAVKVIMSAEARVVLEVLTAIILLEAGLAGKCLKTH